MKKEKTNTTENSEKSTPVSYDSSKAICKLVLRGLAVLIACIVGGILITQAIGWLVELLIGFIPDGIKQPDGKNTNLHFSDFLGGAIGLTVGFVLDKSCIDRINGIYTFRRFMSALCHELGNMQRKDGEGKSCIYIKRDGKYEKVQFNDKGEVSTSNVSECKEVLAYVNELILDNIVTSAETMSLISNLPFAGDFKNRLTDVLSITHKRILEYNRCCELYEQAEREKKKVSEEFCKKALSLRWKINEGIDNIKIDKKCHKVTVKL